jgi:uroporphyrinogen decarboxylase
VRRHRASLEAIYAGESSETCPVFFWKHHPELDQQADSLAAATIAFQDRYDCDLVKISPASTYQLHDHGLIDAWRNDPVGRRTVVQTVIREPEDWRRLAAIDPRRGFTGRFLDCATLVRNRMAPHVPVTITVFNPLFQAATLAGLDVLRAHLRDHPDAVAEGLERLLENTLALIDCLADCGIDGIFLACQQAQRTALPSATYARFGLAHDLACLEAASSLPFNMLHLHGQGIHGDLFADVDDLILHYELDADSPRPDDLLDSDRRVSTGPAPQLLASDVTGLAVRAACEAMLDAWKGPGFIFSPGCSVPLAVGSAPLDAIIAAARTPRADRMRLAGHRRIAAAPR